LRFVITGREGQLGRWLVRLLEASPADRLLRAHDLDTIDFEEPKALAGILDGLPDGRPDVLVNAAAYTAVDRCESEEPRARRVNAEAPGELARLCRRAGVQLVHVSTDFVFDGRAREPYREQSPPAPLSAYGRTKLEGEQRVLAESQDFLVVRTSWLFGPGHNFVRTMLQQAEKRLTGEVSGPLRVVEDQRGSPTYAADLAEGLLKLLAAGASGVVHLSNRGETSWWELARTALDNAGYGELEIQPIPAADYRRDAVLPMYSVLDCSRAAEMGVTLRPWQEAVEAYLRSTDSPIARPAVR
jgi:dTDP-4-dehydrorhamnose reductase